MNDTISAEGYPITVCGVHPDEFATHFVNVDLNDWQPRCESDR